MLRSTVTDCSDVTEGYASTIRRQIHADSEFGSELERLLGTAEFADRQAGWQSELGAIEAGLLRRDLFVATPTLELERGVHDADGSLCRTILAGSFPKGNRLNSRVARGMNI